MDRKPINKILGVWLTEDAGNWQNNVSEMCKKAYGRVAMLTKLKYAGVCTEDLIQVYCVFVRSSAEYCAVFFLFKLDTRAIKQIREHTKDKP